MTDGNHLFTMEDSVTNRLMAGSPDRFSYQWLRYSGYKELHFEQFLQWTAVIDPSDWRGRRVLDVGCGMGRNAISALRLGAREVVALDVDSATVAVAAKNLEVFPNASARVGSAYDFGSSDFDIVMCIGVFHHLGDPDAALPAIASHVRPGGDLVLWVYGSQGVGGLHRALDPIRFVTSRLPEQVVWRLTGPVTALLRRLLGRYAGSSAYARNFVGMPQEDARVVVFDQLIPRVSRYYSLSEIHELMQLPGFEPPQIESVNDISWAIRLHRVVAD